MKWRGLLEKSGTSNTLNMPNGNSVVWVFVGCGLSSWFTPGDQMSPLSRVSLRGGWDLLKDEDKGTWISALESGDLGVKPPSAGWCDGTSHLKLEKRPDCPHSMRGKRRRSSINLPTSRMKVT